VTRARKARDASGNASQSGSLHEELVQALQRFAVRWIILRITGFQPVAGGTGWKPVIQIDLVQAPVKSGNRYHVATFTS